VDANLASVAAKSIAIVQSSYIPWKGYFDLIAMVDEFLFYDDRQYTRRDWRNRNRIKTAQGTQWLTIPVRVKGKYEQRIDETEIADDAWRRRHLQTILHAYQAAPYLQTYRPLLDELYLGSDESRLSLVNRRFVETLCAELEIETTLGWSTDYSVDGDRTSRLVNLCVAAGADVYLSGPSARSYIDETTFARAGIELRYMDYGDYPEYPQLHPPFEHEVSVLDLLLNVGPAGREYMKADRAGRKLRA
jgi:WbqC-like protein family